MKKNRMMNNIQVVAFDCDGVMFDTKAANTAYYNHILNAFGKPPLTSRQFEYAHVHTVDGTLSYLFDDEKILEKVHDYRKTMGYDPFIKYMNEEPDLKPLLKRLRPQYKTAVATNRSDTMDHVLKIFDLEDHFDIVVTSLDVKHPKPHPESLFKILDHFDAKPNEMIYVGDSELDEEAAKEARVPFIAYRNRALTAKHYVQRLKEVENLLNL